MFQPDSTQLANPKTLAERMTQYKTPGVSIAVISENQIEWTKAYGTMDAKTGKPVTDETIFEAASTSKFITAVLVLHLVEKGLIDLDTDVNSYLKSWQVPENEYTKTEKVTLRRLLSHQAGLPTTNYSHDDSGEYPSLLDVLGGQPPALNTEASPGLVPGAQWQYSNIGYNVIELLIEDVTGESFAQLAEKTIFKPLEMNSSTFVYPLDPEARNLEAMPHDGKGNSLEPIMHLTALAHGGLMTTPTDLAKFTVEIMNSFHGRSEKIISRNMARQLMSSQVDLDPGIFGMPVAEGLGVFLMNEGEDLAFLHPGSNLPGLNCWLIGWPAHGTAAVVMTNGAMGEVLAMEIITAVNRSYNR